MKTRRYRLLFSFVICLSGSSLRAQTVPDPGNDPLEYAALKDSTLFSNTGIQNTGLSQDTSFSNVAGSEGNTVPSFSLPSVVYIPGKHPFLLVDSGTAKERSDRIKLGIRTQE